MIIPTTTDQAKIRATTTDQAIIHTIATNTKNPIMALIITTKAIKMDNGSLNPLQVPTTKADL